MEMKKIGEPVVRLLERGREVAARISARTLAISLGAGIILGLGLLLYLRPPVSLEEPPETVAAPGAGRQDTATPSLAPDRLLCNAPERIENFYGVPKTIGGPA
jgi:hypothetical protein